MSKIRVGLYGNNGHQIHKQLIDHPDAEVVAVAAFHKADLPDAYRTDGVRRYDSLSELLADDRVEFVSLCSPVRADQAADAIACLEAGRHVYAEKPCALTEQDLDRIAATAERTGNHFHEMAGTALHQPYLEMRSIVARGSIGEIVQIYAQKSYPMHDRRPQDEDIDGGLTLQNGVHALRFVEHVSGLRVTDIQAYETQLGNPREGELRVASSMIARLANGALASIIANYCNPASFGLWGNEEVRLFGTNGMIESTDGGVRTHLYMNDENLGPVVPSEPDRPYHDRYFGTLLGRETMPFTLEEELHPLRAVIRARDSARAT